jgi:succinate dehydrogenase/fumarate reductase flavoprotein subunit
MGMPSARFVRTVEEFNEAVVGDRAPSVLPPKAALAYAIRKPPFYAFFPLIPGITSSFGGPMINPDAQVLEADGRVLPGLFAAGEVTGGLFFNDYIGGSALANCLVMGRRAGKRAAARSTATARSSVQQA